MEWKNTYIKRYFVKIKYKKNLQKAIEEFVSKIILVYFILFFYGKKNYLTNLNFLKELYQIFKMQNRKYRVKIKKKIDIKKILINFSNDKEIC